MTVAENVSCFALYHTCSSIAVMKIYVQFFVETHRCLLRILLRNLIKQVLMSE